MIYRYLLIDPPVAFLGVDGEFDPRQDVKDKRMGKTIGRVKHESQRYIVRRHPAILQTNRQIHAEASSLMYSDLKLIVQPRDLVRLATPHIICSSTDIIRPSTRVWRHAPWDDFTTEHLTGKVLYKGRELNGPVEPHVVARFQKVSFDAFFDLDDSRKSAIGFYKNDEIRLRPEKETNYARFLVRSEIVKHLVQLLSHSSSLEILELQLCVKIWGSYDDEEMFRAADNRATEIFLEAGILDPLRDLSNVKSFAWEIRHCDYNNERYDYFRDPMYIPFRLKPEHAEIMESLKTTIERNFASNQ